MIKLLVVDDSALMRRRLTQIFASAGGFEIRQARNGLDAIEQNRSFEPDVVTLDINMPEMDGLTALSYLMAERPVPVVMVSSLTEKGTLATFEALNLGAVDYIVKPDGTISLSINQAAEELVAKVRSAASARIRNRKKAPRLPAPAHSAREESARPPLVSIAATGPHPLPTDGLVLIGTSTGGPRTLEEILPLLPESFPWPVLVVQHMPAAFTKSLAERLDQICALDVVEVASPMPVRPGTIYIARGGGDMVVASRAGQLTVLPRPESAQHLWHPSVELLARSVLQHCDARRVAAVLLTGMGNDGSEAFAEIRERGGRTIAESEESCVVFGMPKELIARDGASTVLPAEGIASQLMAWAAR